MLKAGTVIGLALASTIAAAAKPPQTGAAPASAAAAATREAHLSRHPTVALTFDDLPAAGGLSANQTRAGIVSRLAAGLRAAHLKGVYGFVTGTDLEGDPDSQQAIRAWIAAGMNIGNHTWSHPSINDVTAEAYEKDIAEDEPMLRKYAGSRDWRWFRYPYLEEGDTRAKRDDVRTWLRDHGYRIAQVTLTFQDDDWSDPYDRCLAKGDTAAIAWLKQSYLENAAEFIRLGREEEQIAFGHEIPNVLLLHGTSFTTLMLPRLVDLLRREGFRFASLAKVESDPAYAIDPRAALPDGGPLPNQFLNSRHLKYPPFQPQPVDRLNSICR